MATKTKPVIDYPTTELGMLQAAIAEAKAAGDTAWAAFLTGKLPNFGGTSEIPAEEIKEQGTSNGDNSSRHQAKGNGLCTEKQLALIVSLTKEKHGTDLAAEGNESLLEIVKNLTIKGASQAIDRLFKAPRFVAPVAAIEATPVAPVAPVEVAADPIVLPGRYVVKGVMIRVSQGKKGSQWFGTTFVKDVEADRNLRGEKRAEVLAYIAANPAECALAYTQLTGCCSNCNRELINAESIEAAMGPICSGKFGRTYGVSILGETWVEKPKRAKKVAPVVVEDEGQDMAEELRRENASLGIDVAASRSRFARRTPVVVVEEAPVTMVEENRFKGFAIPTTAPVAEPTTAPVRSIAKGTAHAKAQKVMDALTSVGENGSLAVSGETTTLTATVRGAALVVTWDGVSFRYGADSTLAGKKFRNVSELLRLIG